MTTTRTIAATGQKAGSTNLNETAARPATVSKHPIITPQEARQHCYTAQTQNPANTEAPAFEMPPDQQINYSYVQDLIDRHAHITETFDASTLPEEEREVLKILLELGPLSDQIYYIQSYSKNPEILANLEKRAASSGEQKDIDALNAFKRFHSPFNDSGTEPVTFIGNKPMPPGGNLYPENITSDEFNKWIGDHPKDKAAFLSGYTVIKREGGRLIAVPYQVEYEKFFTPMAEIFKRAKEATKNISLQNYFDALIKAVTTKTFPESDAVWAEADKAWLAIKDTRIRPIFGPLEPYKDCLFNIKNCWAIYIGIIDPQKTKESKDFADRLPQAIIDVIKELPMDENLKDQLNIKPTSPMEMAIKAYTAAFGDLPEIMGINQPNNNAVRKSHGSLSVMMLNTIRAKYDNGFLPIAKAVLAPELQKNIDSSIFFGTYRKWIHSHERSHDVVPKSVELTELKEYNTPIEEVKADVMGALVCDKICSSDEEKEYYAIQFLAESFRTMLYGATPAHKQSGYIQFKYLKDKGAVSYDEATGRYGVNFDKFIPALQELLAVLLTIEIKGDYEGAKKLVAQYGEGEKKQNEEYGKNVPPYLQATLNSSKNLSKDIWVTRKITNLP